MRVDSLHGGEAYGPLIILFGPLFVGFGIAIQDREQALGTVGVVLRISRELDCADAPRCILICPPYAERGVLHAECWLVKKTGKDWRHFVEHALPYSVIVVAPRRHCGFVVEPFHCRSCGLKETEPL